METGARLTPTIFDKLVADVEISGLKSAEDLARLTALGYHAFLIGERFMAEADPGQALRDLLALASDGISRGVGPRAGA